MRKLDRDRHVRPAADAFQHPAHCGLVLIRIEACIRIADPALGDHGRGLNRKEGRAGERQVAQVDQMPVRHAPIFGRVLAHWCDHDAVREAKRSHLHGCEQLGGTHGGILERSPRGQKPSRLWERMVQSRQSVLSPNPMRSPTRWSA